MMNIENNIQNVDSTPTSEVQAGQEQSPLLTFVTEDNAFSYDGYQVVRGEFFSHLNEPSITFNNHKVSLNTACLNRFPSVEYVQILVNPNEQKLAVRPSHEDEKDSFLWCTKGTKRRPKQITCRVFFAKIFDMMGWNLDYRYKLLGKLIRTSDEYLFVFDLMATEIYKRNLNNIDKEQSSRAAVFPAEWQSQFGLPIEEHRKQLQINIFKDYTVFSVNNSQTSSPTSISAEMTIEEG